jgi:hypothetical protein
MYFISTNNTMYFISTGCPKGARNLCQTVPKAIPRKQKILLWETQEYFLQVMQVYTQFKRFLLIFGEKMAFFSKTNVTYYQIV